MKTILVLSTLVVGMYGVLTAQKSSGAYFGAGIEAVGMESGVYGLSLQGGYWRQFNRFSVRLGATHVERNRALSSGAFERLRLIGANGELSYDLTASRFRPYLLGGFGLYRFLSTMTLSTGESSVGEGWSPAIIGGLGLRYRIGKIDLFAEGRLHAFTKKRIDCGCFIAPVTIGVRFD